MRIIRQRDKGLHEDPYQMLLPLLIEVDFSAMEQPISGPVVDGVRKSRPPQQEWADTEILHLHHVLLEQSMIQVLNPRSSLETREDVLEWVSKITPYKQKSPVFSFDACCKLSGYDPEELRETLHGEMKYRGIHPNPKSLT